MDRRPERESGISILEGNEKDLYRNFIKNRVSESWIAGDIMITVYKNKDDIPQDMELNDIFFNQNTASVLDSCAKEIVEEIDGVKLLGKYKIKSKFNGVTLDVDCLSTGCKTVLNVLYFPDKIFCLKECGDNTLLRLYSLDRGFVYSDYPIIPFDMEIIKVAVGGEDRIIEDYEQLKEWWENEN